MFYSAGSGTGSIISDVLRFISSFLFSLFPHVILSEINNEVSFIMKT